MTWPSTERRCEFEVLQSCKQWYAPWLRWLVLSLFRSPIRRCVLAFAFVGAIATPAPALAQTAAELARGRDLFWQALSLEVAGDWAGALARIQQAAQIKTTPQVRFHLARCKEQLGRLTEALGDYRLSEYEAVRVNAAELNEIKNGRKNLEKRVPKLVVTVSPALVDASVELDAIALGNIRLGKPTPVDPGEHMLLVRMPDGQSFVKRIAVAEASTTKVELTPPTGFTYSPTERKPETKQMPMPPVVPAETPRRQSTSGDVPSWAWIAAGVGAAGLVSAPILWYVRERALDDLKKQCDGATWNCNNPNLQGTQTRGKWASITAPAALGVGVIGLSVAAYGIFRRPASEAKSESPRVGFEFQADHQFTGVGLSGAF